MKPLTIMTSASRGQAWDFSIPLVQLCSLTHLLYFFYFKLIRLLCLGLRKLTLSQMKHTHASTALLTNFLPHGCFRVREAIYMLEEASQSRLGALERKRRPGKSVDAVKS